MEYNIASAQEYTRLGRTQEWILGYVSHPSWKNPGLYESIKNATPLWIGPTEIEIGKLERICGPEAGLDWHE